MFTSQDWIASKLAKEVKGNHVMETILMTSFWNNMVYILKLMGPLVPVFRLVDNERRPTMGYIYEAINRSKEIITKAFTRNEEKDNEIFKIIDAR